MAAGELGQRLALDQLERNKGMPVLLTDIEDLHDVGMCQPRHDLGLGAKTRDMVRPGVVGGENHLERDQSLETQVARLVHNAHSTPAEHLENLIALHDGLARGTGRELGVSAPGGG